MDDRTWERKMKVAVRLRPPREESDENWRVENNRVLHGTHTFDFGNVFDKDCSNGTVYELLIKNMILLAVRGLNVTAFAYGQTNSGKTFTMTGTENDPGIIHRAVIDLFAEIKKLSDRKFVISVTYMEIYNEEITDLLAAEKEKLEIEESLVHGIYVAGLREEIVNSVDEVFSLIQVGEARRHFGDTNMNGRSSMSHTIFGLVIHSRRKTICSWTGKSPYDDFQLSFLNFVDLAGSERVAQTQAGGVCLSEGEHVDRSLTFLSSIINKLSEDGSQSCQIPYGDTKLTHILQHTLGGKVYTAIICTIAPEQAHIEETKRTLEFASRAKQITTCFKVNKISFGVTVVQQKLDEYEILEENAKMKEVEKDEESEEKHGEEDEESEEKHGEEDEKYEESEEEHGEEDEEEYDAGDYGERYSGSSEEDDL